MSVVSGRNEVAEEYAGGVGFVGTLQLGMENEQMEPLMFLLCPYLDSNFSNREPPGQISGSSAEQMQGISVVPEALEL